MKIILSRKLLDSSFGRFPSPILPDGTLCPVPIPEDAAYARSDSVTYGQIRFGNRTLGDFLPLLTNGMIRPSTFAHLDPDLSEEALERLPGWRPVFGQAGPAETHLRSRGVDVGDIFLFFGWFRETCYSRGRLEYTKGARDVHLLFGWLQIDQRVELETAKEAPLWASYHPHVKENLYAKSDSLYISSKWLQLNDSTYSVPGGGVFLRYRDTLVLTAPGRNRSVWQLPSWFFPESAEMAMSYHGDLRRWSRTTDGVLLNSVGRGQEFVMDTLSFPESLSWIKMVLGLI